MTIFLDCVASEFIERAENVKGLEAAVRATKRGRALGLGQCGYHTLLQQKMLPFEGLEAHMLSQQIAKHIDDESLRASRDMAIELGEPEWCEGFGVRNTHRIAIAPTKSCVAPNTRLKLVSGETISIAEILTKNNIKIS